jgi:hypothetical protein
VAFTEWPKLSRVVTSWSKNHDLQVHDQIAHPRQLYRPIWNFPYITTITNVELVPKICLWDLGSCSRCWHYTKNGCPYYC